MDDWMGWVQNDILVDDSAAGGRKLGSGPKSAVGGSQLVVTGFVTNLRLVYCIMRAGVKC